MATVIIALSIVSFMAIIICIITISDNIRKSKELIASYKELIASYNKSTQWLIEDIVSDLDNLYVGNSNYPNVESTIKKIALREQLLKDLCAKL